MVLLSRVALAMRPPEGVGVTLDRPPAEHLPGPIPPGTFLAPSWDLDARNEHLPNGAMRANRAAVFVLGEADDGTLLLGRVGDDGLHAWEMTAAGVPSAPWPDDPRTAGGAIGVKGVWFLPGGGHLDLRAAGGAPIATTPDLCDGHPTRVDGGVWLACARSAGTAFFVGRDCGVRQGPATLTGPGGVLVLEADKVTLRVDGVDRWSVPLDHASGISWSPDGRHLLLGGRLVDAATGERVGKLSGEGWTRDGLVRSGPFTYDPDTGLPPTRPDGHGGRITALAWSADGMRLASAAEDRAVLVWDPGGGPPLARLDGPTGIASLAWYDDGSVLVVWDDGAFGRWVVGEPRPRFRVPAPGTSRHRPGTAVPLSGARTLTFEGDAARIVGPDGEPVASWRPREGTVGQIAAICGRPYAVSGGSLWDVGSGERVVLGVDEVRVLPGGASAHLERGGPQSRDWTPPGCADEPAAPLPPALAADPSAVSRSGAVAAARDGSLWILPAGPVADRPPRDLAVLAHPAGLPDPGVLVAGLRVGRVVGDRVTFVTPGDTSPPPWIDVDDPGAVTRLRSLAAAGRDGDLGTLACHPRERVAPSEAGHAVAFVTVPGFAEELPSCVVQRASGHLDAAEVLRVVRRGW